MIKSLSLLSTLAAILSMTSCGNVSTASGSPSTGKPAAPC